MSDDVGAIGEEAVEGASGPELAHLFEQSRRYGVHADFMSQSPPAARHVVGDPARILLGQTLAGGRPTRCSSTPTVLRSASLGTFAGRAGERRRC